MSKVWRVVRQHKRRMLACCADEPLQSRNVLVLTYISLVRASTTRRGRGSSRSRPPPAVGGPCPCPCPRPRPCPRMKKERRFPSLLRGSLARQCGATAREVGDQ